ncbi:unnamed protein product, partial [Cyprideis torosa]
MKRQRQAKIIATLGPSSRTAAQIKALYHAGADVFRLNFSHGSHYDHLRSYQIIRQLELEVQSPIGILMDLQGPKLRIGTFVDDSAKLKTGNTFRLDMDDTPGTEER